MAMELHHLNTHGMMEQAGKVLDGVVRLKERIAELEKLNHDLCERVTENDEIRLHWEEIEQTRAENERMKARITELEKENAELKEQYRDMDVTHTVHIAKMNAKIEELESSLESEKDSRYADSVDAGMENRRLKRALWLAREQTAIEKHNHFALCHNHSTDLYLCINGASIPTEMSTTMRLSSEWSMIWKRVVAKCRAKAEEYK